MIERAYVWVDGPKCAGKTALIERFLESCRSQLVMAARMVPVPRRGKTGEVRGGNTRRYKATGMVVVNVRSDRDREGATRLADEFRQACRDPGMSQDLFQGWRRLNAVSVFVANLSDPKDHGTRKAVARMKRVLARAGRG